MVGLGELIKIKKHVKNDRHFNDLMKEIEELSQQEDNILTLEQLLKYRHSIYYSYETYMLNFLQKVNNDTPLIQVYLFKQIIAALISMCHTDEASCEKLNCNDHLINLKFYLIIFNDFYKQLTSIIEQK